jgi:hypothetical protein
VENVYGDYGAIPSTADTAEMLKWVVEKLTVLADQVLLPKGEPRVAIGWKCYEKEVVENDGAREAGSDGGVSGGAAPVRGG